MSTLKDKHFKMVVINKENIDSCYIHYIFYAHSFVFWILISTIFYQQNGEV